MTLAEQNSLGNKQVQASYVVVAGVTYSLQVTDPAKADAFFRANDRPNWNGNDFPPGSSAGDLWQAGLNRMGSMSAGVERDCAIMAYVLDRANAGIVLSRMPNGYNQFAPYGIVENKDKNGGFYPTKCQ